MNKTLSLLIIIFCFNQIIFSQATIESISIDEETNDTIISTNYEWFRVSYKYGKLAIFQKVSSVNEQMYLELLLSNSKIFTILSGKSIKLDFESGKSLLFDLEEEVTTETGHKLNLEGLMYAFADSYQSALVKIPINEEEAYLLAIDKANKITVLTNDGVIERKLNVNKTVRLNKSISLVWNAKKEPFRYLQLMND